MPPNYTNIISISRHKKLNISSPKLILFFMSVRKKGKKGIKWGLKNIFSSWWFRKKEKKEKCFSWQLGPATRKYLIQIFN